MESSIAVPEVGQTVYEAGYACPHCEIVNTFELVKDHPFTPVPKKHRCPRCGRACSLEVQLTDEED